MGIRKKRTAGSIVCILFTALFSVLAVSGCAKTEDAAAGSVEQEEQEVQIGLSFESFVIERWMRERDVFVSAAKELGAEVNVQNANGDVEEQISQIEYFIKKQVDVIVVVAGDCEALSDVMIKAREAGIKTVSYDRLIMNAGCDLYISFDNTEVGRLMAESMLENIPAAMKVSSPQHSFQQAFSAPAHEAVPTIIGFSYDYPLFAYNILRDICISIAIWI